MTFIQREARVAAFVGFVMAIWISPFLAVGTFAALMDAPQTHAPLVITLLLTSIAIATISVITSSVNGKTHNAEVADHRSVATFIFVNSAGTMVGLVTDFSASIEKWQAGGPNGLTHLYGQMFRSEMPVEVYATILASMVVAAGYFVVRGSALISADREPSERELNTLGGWSGSLLSLWIFACMPWQPLSVGAETVASAWTALVYALTILAGAALYGFAGIRLVRWLASIAFKLAQSASEVLSDPKTWRFLFTVSVVSLVCIATLSAAFFAIAWLVKGAGTVSNQFDPETAASAFQNSTNAFAWTLWLVAKAIAVVIAAAGLLLLPVLVRLAWRAIRRIELSFALKLPSMRIALPRLSPFWAWFSGYFVKGLRLMGRAIERHRVVLLRSISVVAPALFLVATSTNGFYTAPPVPRGSNIIAKPPPTPLLPVDHSISLQEISLEFEPVSLCDISPGSVEWSYESHSRVSVDLSACRLGARVELGDALLVVAMSTNGVRSVTEEKRSRRRLNALMNWARFQNLPVADIYGLDLGMAAGPFSHSALSSVFGVSWSERPLIGVKISSDQPIEPWMVGEALGDLIDRNTSLGTGYSKCVAYVNNLAARTKILDCNKAKPIDLAGISHANEPR